MIDEQRYRSLIQQLATGGITGNNNYNQISQPSQPMSYMNGGGVGSMMQPRRNFKLGGGEFEENQTIGLNNIINSNLFGNENNMQVADAYNTPTDGAYGFNLIELDKLKNAGYDPAELSTYPNQEDVQSIIRNLEPTAKLSYDKLSNGTMTDANTSLFNQENVITPMSKPVTGITDRNRGQVIERNPSAPFNRGFTMADVAGENLPSGIMSGYTQPSADYPDMIRNPEGFPNALQNLERFQDNRFEDLDFQPGYNFKDAPNETNTLQELYQNRSYNNNPYTGFIDKNIMSRGNPNNSLVNKTKNAIGSGMNVGKNLALGAFGKIANVPAGIASILGNVFNRDPNAPSYQTYDPTGKIDYSKLNTTNLNDFYDSNPDSETYGTTRFDRAKPGSFGSFRTLADYFNRNKNIKNTGITAAANNKKAADAIKDAERQAELNRRQSIVDAQTARGFTTSGGSGNYSSSKDHSGAGGYGGTGRASNEARSNDLGFSDIRLKDNIELVGKSPSNINIYNFTYLNDPKVYQGVMAQEVPWASVEHNSGYLMVDYNKVDVDFKSV